MNVITIPRERDRRRARVAAYVRVSSADSAQEDSLENQTAHYRKMAAADPAVEFAGIYADKKSGTDASRREGFQRMVRDALAGKIDRIWVKSVSRFSRNSLDICHYLKVLTSHGIAVYFEEEQTEIRDGYMSLALAMSAAAAQNEAFSISENVRKANRKRFSAGAFSPGRHACFGYMVKDGKLTPDKNAEAVRFIFRAFVSGESCGNIHRKLMETRVVGRGGKPLSRNAIYYILRNEIYRGDIMLLKTPYRDLFSKQVVQPKPYYISGDHEAIVSPQMWEAAQREMNRRRMRAGGNGADAARRTERVAGFSA